MCPQGLFLFIPRSPFRPRSPHLPTEGRNPLGTMLDEMRGEAIRGIDVIKHHDVDIADRERAVNDHERKVEVSSGEVGKGCRVGEQITSATCSSRSRLREIASFSGLSSVWHR